KLKTERVNCKLLNAILSHCPFSDTETCRKRLKKKRKSRS
ncbi:unnamed protein product, partial [Brassica rapa subsp. trilocularis]